MFTVQNAFGIKLGKFPAGQRRRAVGDWCPANYHGNVVGLDDCDAPRTVVTRPHPLIVRDEPAAGRSRSPPANPTQRPISEIFNKFGRSIESGRCTMRNRDLVSDGFLALIVAGLLLLCSSLLVIAFS